MKLILEAASNFLLITPNHVTTVPWMTPCAFLCLNLFTSVFNVTGSLVFNYLILCLSRNVQLLFPYLSIQLTVEEKDTDIKEVGNGCNNTEVSVTETEVSVNKQFGKTKNAPFQIMPGRKFYLKLSEQLSQNHRIVWLGRDLKDPLILTPLPWAGMTSTRPDS